MLLAKQTLCGASPKIIADLANCLLGYWVLIFHGRFTRAHFQAVKQNC